MCGDKFFCGIVGLIGGTTTGTWVHMLLLALVVVCTTNWDVETQKAQERLWIEKRKYDGESVLLHPNPRGDHVHDDGESVANMLPN